MFFRLFSAESEVFWKKNGEMVVHAKNNL